MLLAVHPSLAALDVEDRLLHAAIVCATFAMDVDHTVLSMLLAVRPLLALEIEGRVLCAGIRCTTIATDIHHAIFSILCAVHHRLAALNVKSRSS